MSPFTASLRWDGAAFQDHSTWALPVEKIPFTLQPSSRSTHAILPLKSQQVLTSASAGILLNPTTFLAWDAVCRMINEQRSSPYWLCIPPYASGNCIWRRNPFFDSLAPNLQCFILMCASHLSRARALITIHILCNLLIKRAGSPVYRVLFACHFLARVLLAMSIDSSRILLNKQAGVNVVTSSRKRPCARLAV